MRALAVVVLFATGCGSLLRERPPLTETSPLTPTGELTPRGHLEHDESFLSTYHEIGVGLSDRVDLRLGELGLPIPLVSGDLQLRTSVVARDSKWRVIVGPTLTWTLAGAATLWGGVGTTVAYRGDRWSVHGTLRAARRAGHDDEVGLATAGVVRRYRKVSLFVDAGRISWLRDDGWSVGTGVVGGAWFEADDLRIGLTGAIVRVAGVTLPILPLASFSWIYR